MIWSFLNKPNASQADQLAYRAFVRGKSMRLHQKYDRTASSNEARPELPLSSPLLLPRLPPPPRMINTTTLEHCH